MFARLADAVVEHRRSVIAVVIVLAVAAGVVASRARFDFTPQTLFAGQGTLVQDLESFRKTFGNDDAVVLVALEALKPETQDVLTPPALNWQAGLAGDLATVSGVIEVQSLPTLNVLDVQLTSQTGVVPAPIITRLPVDEDSAAVLRERLDDLPMLNGTLTNARRSVAAVPAILDPNLTDVDAVERVVHDIRGVLSRRKPPEGYRTHLGGLPVIRAETIDDLKRDQAGLLPMGGVVYLCALLLMFRRISGTLIPLSAVGAGLAWTVALLVLAGQTLNVVSNVLPMLLLIIGISTCVQIVAAYSEEASLNRRDRVGAVRRALAHSAKASLFATLTTMIGFGSLAITRSYVLRDFGLQAVLGVALLWVAVILVLGSLFPWFSPPPFGREAGPLIRGTARAAFLAGHSVSRHPVTYLLLCTAATAAALLIGQRSQVNSYTVETYGPRHRVVRTLRFFERELSGVLPLEIRLRAAPGRILDPDIYLRVRQLQERILTGVEGVLLARSYVDLHRPALERFERASGEPPDRDTLRNRLARTDRVMRRFPEVTHYRSFLSQDGRQARIMLRTRDLGTQRLLEVIREIEAELNELLPPSTGVLHNLTGDAYVNTIAMDNLIRDLYGSLLTASLTIFGMIALQFRSLRVGIIAAIPNLMPLALTLGYMGLRGYDMNMGNVIVFTISLGFADDTTIHFLFRFREEYHASGSVGDAIDHTFAGTGRAIIQTSLLISAGLTVLLFSDFLPTRHFGELTLVTLTGNLLGVLFVLPACLMLFWREAPAAAVNRQS